VRKWFTRVLVLAILAVAVVYGGILLWTKVIDKPEDQLSGDDLTEALVTDSSTTMPIAESTAPLDPSDVSGEWIATNESTLGYRVKEVLGGIDTEGVGRTNQVEGRITIDGTVVVDGGFTVEVASIESDSDRRDSQFTGRIMDVATHPTATFVITQPIDFGAIPESGQQVTVSANGELTLRGTTRPVMFDLTAEYTNGRIGVLGSIPVVFADYGIPNPSNPFVTTGDDGLLEFVLVFTRA